MERHGYRYLLEWKKSQSRKPLILRGARQVGKTWIVRKLGQSFDTFIECNFEEDPSLNKIFSDKLSPDHIIHLLENYLNTKITPGASLLFLDEIQLCPRAIMSLRYFYEKLPELHVIAAGSLIEFELENISIPVGRVEFKYLKPLSFQEYLSASDKDMQIESILNHPMREAFPEPLHSQLLEEFKIYSMIGGMPESVKTYLETRNVNNCQNVLDSLVSTFKSDFKKYARRHQMKYLELLFDRSPFLQGAKFKYSNISTDYKTRELKPALDLLCRSDLFSKIKHTDANGIPLGAESTDEKFKIIMLDAGISNRIIGLKLREHILRDDFHLINKGQLAEAAAGQELQGYNAFHQKQELFYWHREGSSNAEVDYVIEYESRVIPLEVKDAATGRLRSILSFLERKPDSPYGIKISRANFSLHQKIQSIPFYGIMKLFQES